MSFGKSNGPPQKDERAVASNPHQTRPSSLIARNAEFPRPSMLVLPGQSSGPPAAPNGPGWRAVTFFLGALVAATVMVAVHWELYYDAWFPSGVREFIGIGTPVAEPTHAAQPEVETPVPDRRPNVATDRMLVSERGYVWPAVGRITQEFGCTDFILEPWNEALGCRFHYGIDISGLSGTPILAAVGGSVVVAGWADDGYGYRVLMVDAEGWTTLYAHLCCPPALSAGQLIERGQQIGLMGTTGASSGNHLHFAIHAGGAALNPREFLPPEIDLSE